MCVGGGCTQARPSPFDPGFPHLWSTEATAPTSLPQGAPEAAGRPVARPFLIAERAWLRGHPLLVLCPDEAGPGQMEATVTDG